MMVLKTCLAVLVATLTLVAAYPGSARHASPQPKVIHNFGKGIWPENMIVRPNGQIIGGLLTSPEIYEIDPTNGSLYIVHTFEDKTGVFGFAETESDHFYVVASNFSLKTFQGVRGTPSLYELDFRQSRQPNVTKLLDFPGAKFFDGLATLNSEQGLLITGDAATGDLYVIDVHTRTWKIVSHSPRLSGNSQLHIGIDGIKVYQDYLYFSNAAESVFDRVLINRDTGFLLGDIQVLMNLTSTNISGPIDDFTFGHDGAVYLTVAESGVYVAHPPLYETPELVAPIFGSTAAGFGRTADTLDKLYVISTGGDFAFPTGDFVNPALLSEVEIVC